jgi:hypothetical protein
MTDDQRIQPASTYECLLQDMMAKMFWKVPSLDTRLKFMGMLPQQNESLQWKSPKLPGPKKAWQGLTTGPYPSQVTTAHNIPTNSWCGRVLKSYVVKETLQKYFIKAIFK